MLALKILIYCFISGFLILTVFFVHIFPVVSQMQTLRLKYPLQYNFYMQSFFNQALVLRVVISAIQLEY